MSDDLVSRLRESANDYADCGTHCDLEKEAADEIEEQRHTINGLGIGYEARGQEIDRLKALLERINMAACYASEENTDARAEMLLLIGKLARGEVKP